MNASISIKDLTKEQINDLRKQIEAYDSKPKRWKPEKGRDYWLINSRNEPESMSFSDNWFDDMVFAANNMFPTRELAEAEAERRRITAELQIFADEHNDEIDWSDCDILKYFIYFDHNPDMVLIGCRYSYQYIGSIYFSSIEIAQQAIDTIGGYRLRKLFV